jgi:hypothetical protein
MVTMMAADDNDNERQAETTSVTKQVEPCDMCDILTV